MAIYKLKNRLGKKQVYNLLKFYFPLDECRWYTFDRIDKFLYRLSFGGFEYIPDPVASLTECLSSFY